MTKIKEVVIIGSTVNLREIFLSSYKIFKENLILLLPGLIFYLFVSITFLIFAIISFIFFLSNLYIISLIIGMIFLIITIIFYFINNSGWLNMYGDAIKEEKCSISSYIYGIKKYFARISLGLILRYLISISLLGITVFTSFSLLVKSGFFNLFKELLNSPFHFGNILQDFFSDVSFSSLILLFLLIFCYIILEMIISFILFMWRESVILEDKNVFNSYEESINFSFENFWELLLIIVARFLFLLGVNFLTIIFTFLFYLPFNLIFGKNEIFLNVISFVFNIFNYIIIYILQIYFTIACFLFYKERKISNSRLSY